jgi:hypothetical protein
MTSATKYRNEMSPKFLPRTWLQCYFFLMSRSARDIVRSIKRIEHTVCAQNLGNEDESVSVHLKEALIKWFIDKTVFKLLHIFPYETQPEKELPDKRDILHPKSDLEARIGRDVVAWKRVAGLHKCWRKAALTTFEVLVVFIESLVATGNATNALRLE